MPPIYLHLMQPPHPSSAQQLEDEGGGAWPRHLGQAPEARGLRGAPGGVWGTGRWRGSRREWGTPGVPRLGQRLGQQGGPGGQAQAGGHGETRGARGAAGGHAGMAPVTPGDAGGWGAGPGGDHARCWRRRGTKGDTGGPDGTRGGRGAELRLRGGPRAGALYPHVQPGRPRPPAVSHAPETFNPAPQHQTGIQAPPKRSKPRPQP